MEDILNKVEAVLFSAGKKVDVDFIRKTCRVKDRKVIEEALEELKKIYEDRQCSLTLVQEGDFWKLTVRDKYADIARRIIPETEMPKTVMETLAVIAWKQPVLQSEVIRIRTNKAYEHIKELERLGFITTEKFGRTKKLKITQKFLDYFDIGGVDDIKEFFKRIREREKKKEEELSGREAEIARLVQGITEAAQEQSLVSGAIESRRGEAEATPELSERSEAAEEASDEIQKIGQLEVYETRGETEEEGRNRKFSGAGANQEGKNRTETSYPSDEEVRQRHEIHSMLSGVLEKNASEESSSEAEADSSGSTPALKAESESSEDTATGEAERSVHEMGLRGEEKNSGDTESSGEQETTRDDGTTSVSGEKSNIDKLFEEADEEDDDESRTEL